jgi:DNA-directed RNA polymerase alpha subunit
MSDYCGYFERESSEKSKPKFDLSKNIWELNIPSRAVNCLEHEGIRTIDQLMRCTWHDLLRIKNMGIKSAVSVVMALQDAGLDWPGINDPRLSRIEKLKLSARTQL